MAETARGGQTLGGKLAALRKTRGVTQEHFARQIGVSAQAVSKWEHDKSYPDIMLLPRIAEFYEVALEELWAYDSRTPRSTVAQEDDPRIVHVEAIAPSGDRISLQVPLHSFDSFAQLAKTLPILKHFFAKPETIASLVKLAALGRQQNLLSIEQIDGGGLNIWMEE